MAVVGKKSLNPGDPILTGGPGPDVFDAPVGNAGINAFSGIDTVNFNFRLVDATVSYDGGTVIIDTATSHTELTGAERYVFTDGMVEENDGNPLVDDLYYYSHYHDVWTSGADADAHFAQFGWHEDRNPSAFFDTVLYLVANSDVAAAGVNPLLHFHQFGWKEGRLPSLRFDIFQYLQNDPDVAAAGVDPLEQFLAFGGEQGRVPYVSPASVVGPSGFDYAFYLLHNPDVAAAGVNPLQHFNTFGWKEGRDPNAYFDTRGYLATYADVAAAGVNPFEHFMTFGWKEGRDPSPAFDSSAYLLANPDVAAAGTNTLVHYLTYGVHEGRPAFATAISNASPGAVFLPEGAAAGTETGIDLDWGGWVSSALSFSIVGDTSGGGFVIDPASGVVTVADGTKLDFETSGAAHSYIVTVQVQIGTLTGTQDFAINIIDVVPTPPVDSDAAPNTLAEGAAAGAAVGVTLFSTDINGPPTTYSLTDNAGGRFAVDPNTGIVTVADPALIDFASSGSSHQFTISGRASTSGGTFGLAQDFSITITAAAPSTPTDVNGAPNTVFEGSANGTPVGLTVSSSVPSGSAPTFSLTDSAGGRFAIDPATGVVTVANGALLDHEAATNHSITVRATGGALSSSQGFVIAVGDVNDNPPVFTSSAAPSVAENTTAVVTLASTDADTVGTNPPIFTITGGTDQALFTITGGNKLQFIAARDFETQAHSYSVQVTANDGANNAVQNLTVALADANDNAPVFTSSATLSVVENATTVVTLTATDADTVGTSPPTFTITGGADSTLFTIVGGNQLRFINPADFETQQNYGVQVTASDGAPAHDTVQNLTVTLTDTNDTAPVFTSSASPGVAENTSAVVTLTTTDPDTVGNNPPSFAITGGADAALFTINGSNQLAFTAAPDFENPGDAGGNNVYNVQVTANDGANQTVQNIAVTVTDTNDIAPDFISTASPSVAENTTAVVTLTTVDADTVGTNPPAFTITGGADQALFTITGGNKLQFVGPRDFETQAHNYAVQVTANDGTNQTTQSLSVTLIDQNDNAPVFTSNATPSIAENTTAVVSLTTTDVDTVGTTPPTFTITGGADAGLFSIVSGNQLKFVNPADFETQQTYAVQVTADDGANQTPQSISVSLTDVNDNAPIFSSGTSANVSEGVSTATVVYDAEATDADGTAINNTIAYSLSAGGDNDLFNINATTGEVTFKVSPDFETPTDAGGNNVYDIVVHAVNGADDVTRNVAITVGNLPPAFAGTPDSDPDPNQVSNGSGAGVSAQIDADASDPAGGTVTYELIDSGGLTANGGGRFTIDPATGVITVSGGTPIVFDNGVPANNFIPVTVRASDASGANAFQDFVIEITPNAAPQITSNGGGPTASVSMNENTTVTGVDVDAIDPDNGPVTPLAFSIVAGGDGALFSIDPGTGVLSFTGAPSFESPLDSGGNNTYVVTVRAFDGAATDDQTITITVDDLNEPPVIGSNGGGATASITVNENQTAVTDVDATDEDAGQTLTYSTSGGADAALFNIDPSTGLLTFVSGRNFESPTDTDTNNTYVVAVRATDNGTGLLFDEQTITVTVADVNEQPTLTATGASITYTEDSPSEDPSVPLFTGVAASALEPGQNLDRLVLTVSNVVDTSERLLIDGSTISLVASDSVTATNGMSVNVAFTGNTATVTVEKVGGITSPAMQALIADLAYSNSDESPTAGARVVTLVSLRDVGSNVAPNDNIFESIGVSTTINVVPVNDAPVVTAPGAINTYIEGAGLATGTPVFVDTAFTVSDVDSDNLASATISITAGLTGDVLSFTPQFGLADTNAAAEVLALSGSATKAQWETVLRSITFATSNQDPGTSRTVSITVNDGTANSATITKNVIITPVNDEPTLTATANGGGAVTFTEASPPGDTGSGPVDLFSAADASTVEAGQTFHNLVVTVSNVGTDATEFLVAGTSSTPVDLVNANSEPVGLSGGGTAAASVSVAGVTATITFENVGGLTEPQLEALINSLKYDNNDNTPTAGVNAHIVTITSLSDSGSNTSPNDNTASLSIATKVTVVATNDAPVAADFTFDGANAAIGNTALVVNNPTDGAPDPTGPQKTISGDLLAAPPGSDPDTAAASWTITAVGGGTTVTDANGTITFQPDGDFTYFPAAGVTGNVVYSYQLNDNDPLGSKSDAGQITINIATPKVWYVNGATGSDTTGDGTSGNPFASLAPLSTGGSADALDGANDIIFVYGGTYSTGIVLENGQQLIGQSQGLTVNATALEAASGGNPLINGAVVLASGNTVDGINIGNTGSSSVFALSGTNVGNAVFTDGSINNTSGGAINITGSGTGMNLQFTGVSSTGSGTNAINFGANTQGTFSAGGGALANATGAVVNIAGDGAGGNDNINFTYGGTISDDVGTLVSVSGQTGGTVDFNGAITDGDDGDGSGVSLTNNIGATIRFDGGLTLSTGANAAFTATGGGTVAVTDPSGAPFNKITTTMGTALNVANTNVGSDGLTFQSISANGASTGVILNSTGTGPSNGGLTVTGTGSAGSGGTIQNTGEGLVATSTKNLSLSWMNFTNPNSTEGTVNNVDNATFNSGAKAGINLSSVSGAVLDHLSVTGAGGAGGVQAGINGQNVSNLTLSNSTVSGFGDESNESVVMFWNLTGTSSITSSTFGLVPGDTSGATNLIDVRGDTGALTLNVTGSTFQNTFDSMNGSAGLIVTAVSNQTVNLNVSNNDFLNLKTSGVETLARDTSTMNVNIADGGVAGNGNNFIPTGSNLMRAIGLNAEDTAHLNFNVNHNVKIYGAGGPIINVFGINTAVINGRIDNNPDIRNIVNDSAGSPIFIHPEDASTAVVEIIGNTITNQGHDPAIFVTPHGDGAGPSTDDGSLDITISSNTITNTFNTAAGNVGIDVRAGSNNGDTTTTYAKVTNNTVTLSANANDAAFLTREGSNISHLYFDGPVSGANNQAIAQNYWNANGNTPTNSVFVLDAGGALAYASIPGAHNGGHVLTPSNPTALFASAGGVQSASPSSRDLQLSQAELNGMVTAAITHWAAAGLPVAQIQQLLNVTYDVGATTSGWLAESRPGHVTISIDADGHGWFVDTTPFDNSEFSNAVASTKLVANPTDASAGHIDLLTTVMHEMGEQLGLNDMFDLANQSDLMFLQLADGERRFPDASNVAQTQQLIAAWPAGLSAGERRLTSADDTSTPAGAFSTQQQGAASDNAAVTPAPHTATFVGHNIVDRFDAEYYLAQNPDVAAVFDTPGHLTHFADVADAGVDPPQHYEAFGWKEGREPSAGVDSQSCLAANPAVPAAQVDPLDPFLRYG
jgi:hypothetical protein